MDNHLKPGDILGQLIRIPSVNPISGDVDREICFEHRMSDWLEAFFRSIDAPYERIAVVPGREGVLSRDNIVARYTAGSAKPTILLDAHQDTVPIGGMQAPFDPICEDGRISGRGACDVKGGMAAMLSAFARLIRERPTAANVVLSCTCDEEATAMGVRQLVKYWDGVSGKSKLLSSPPTACIVAEPTDLDIVLAHRGVLRFRIHTQGRACHASDPSQGENAIYAMAPILLYLQAEAHRLAAATSTDIDAAQRLCGNPSLSVGLIQGGTAINIVPAACVIDIDRRLIPGEDHEGVWATFHQQVSKFKTAQCERPWLSAPAMGNQHNGGLAEALNRSMLAVGVAGARQLGVPYCTNASTISLAGIPSVVFGPGSIAQAHTDDEYIDVAQLETASDVYYQFCATFDGLA